MKERNKSKMTVIILFILMLISIALLLVFIIMAANNLEENQRETSEVQSLVEEQISSNDYLSPAATAELNDTKKDVYFLRDARLLYYQNKYQNQIDFFR